MPNSTEQTLDDLLPKDAEMIKAVATGVSFIRIGISQLTGVVDPIVNVTISREAYEALLRFNGAVPDETSEVQWIGVPFVPVKN